MADCIRATSIFISLGALWAGALCGDPPPAAAADTWHAKIDKGNSQALQGHFPEAARIYQESINDARGYGDRSQEMAQSIARLASMDAEMGRIKEARAKAEQALAIAVELKTKHKNLDDLLPCMEDLAGALTSHKITADRALGLEEGLKIRETLFDSNHTGLKRNRDELLDAYESEHQYKQEEALLKRMYAAAVKASKEEHPSVRQSPESFQMRLALVYQMDGQLTEAEKLYRARIADYEKTGNAHFMRKAYLNLAKVLRATHREPEAKKVDAQLQVLLKSRPEFRKYLNQDQS
ncbi:MAG TPA: hypothetical protein V6C72_08235 [Chroococcales cyanobacterium]